VCSSDLAGKLMAKGGVAVVMGGVMVGCNE
jgi:hypothetical protein